MKPVLLSAVLTGQIPLGSLSVAGWVKTHRQSKKVSFIALNDGSTIHNLQLVVEAENPSYAPLAAKIGTGAAVRAEGTLVESPAKGQRFEFQVGTIHLVGEADPETYPLQKKGHSLEFLREILHLRPRSTTIGAMLRVRSAAALAVHEFFNEQGFYYLHTPIITTSDCEGGGEMFRVTTLDDKNPPLVEGKVDYSQDFFKAKASLTVSGQLDAEICAMGLSRVYTFGPTFRAENSNTTRHLAEFWMIEPEAAFFELEDNMQLAQDFVKSVLRKVLGRCSEELAFLSSSEWAEPGRMEVLERVAEASFTTIDYTEAISILEKCGQAFEYPVRWGVDLQAEHERYLTEQHVKGPTIVVNYPKEIKSFYMRMNEDGKTVRAMDVLVPKLGEIIGGSQREERHDVLLQRIRDFGLVEKDYWWYLELRKFGTVPHSGFGLGFERLLMYITGLHNIRDVIPFPRYPGFAEF